MVAYKCFVNGTCCGNRETVWAEDFDELQLAQCPRDCGYAIFIVTATPLAAAAAVLLNHSEAILWYDLLTLRRI
jgi:hypothetical protein